MDSFLFPSYYPLNLGLIIIHCRINILNTPFKNIFDNISIKL
ncbi:hypothetical protein HMPREF1987_01886 [Peptostreptococcaceae bacterium oral taxon 113 str. W5053]|nr:hypothetical protein HMPREF1987_01886 [Peptostreptococcaceae bacterium oral taxon 113 str. W5053]